MCILAARGFQGRKEYGRLLEKSSQLETKMIYFLQQVDLSTRILTNNLASLPTKYRLKFCLDFTSVP